MKRPDFVWFSPLDCKKDEDGAMWLRVPAWLVRAYRLKEHNLMGYRVVVRINNKPISQKEGSKRYKYSLLHKYFSNNWVKKLNRESKKERKKRKTIMENKLDKEIALLELANRIDKEEELGLSEEKKKERGKE